MPTHRHRILTSRATTGALLLAAVAMLIAAGDARATARAPGPAPALVMERGPC